MGKIILNKDDAIGMIYFIPIGKFVEGVPCKGYIKERYQEGSVYIGEGEYDGKNFYRQGFGVQDFTNSTFVLGSTPIGMKAYKYVGWYDRHISTWMYGNGIFFLVDENGKPSGYSKGFFNNTVRLSDWLGDFDENYLIDGYTVDMSVELIPYQTTRHALKEKFKDVKNVDYLVFGDSWTQMWQDNKTYPDCTYYDDVKGLDCINVGIGGTTYKDWIEFIDELVIIHNPKKILINLGFNDLHAGKSVDQVYNDYLTVIKKLKDSLPDVKIFVTGVTHCSVFIPYHDDETKVNELIKSHADSTDFITYVSVNEQFIKDGKMIENMDEYCIDDRLHLNYKGYKIWAPYIMKFFK